MKRKEERKEERKKEKERKKERGKKERKNDRGKRACFGHFSSSTTRMKKQALPILLFGASRKRFFFLFL